MSEKENVRSGVEEKLDYLLRSNFSEEELAPRFREGNESAVEAVKRAGVAGREFASIINSKGE